MTSIAVDPDTLTGQSQEDRDLSPGEREHCQPLDLPMFDQICAVAELGWSHPMIRLRPVAGVVSNAQV